MTLLVLLLLVARSLRGGGKKSLLRAVVGLLFFTNLTFNGLDDMVMIARIYLLTLCVVEISVFPPACLPVCLYVCLSLFQPSFLLRRM